MANEPIKIPQATAKRLPLYYRFLKNLHSSGKQRVSSAELSEAVKVDSATIRRDFSYFGALGKKGYGYNVNYLLGFFRKTLDQDELTKVALIGVGNLGTAFLNYNFLKNNNTKIEVAFDVDESKVGTKIGDVPVHHMDDLEEVIINNNIQVAILTVPAPPAQAITDRMVNAKIKGILNFTPARLTVPASIRIHHIDLAVELQSLVYFLKNYPEEM
ncbi:MULTISPECIES: redox-sensing transcriptional repressor Rex [Cytobacillus]|jgi:redox-sensing transcriptional repressor|uniref:Redox-sensing transcriptional repressor Rex n=2 Tax=Cytobacillus oceanisediminis TaxID=665099 RepID=A0A160M670_9BACI|nr:MULTISPECIES: redox-sensing transcriptional repressor Rex [Cytobacillus]MBY0162470.1 redox-sensing transcriptional repressor Rex [Cytobacillus firmus]AND37897.1 redox-sensing transcriptional repressor Rex [Cytobacillus oceanisediminis 2691]MBU8733226.1 redox-sensing transcriptional repressor Rex [Cytobacillus oceanisediminis]MCM3246469.1 redox-sensing transcriptional repressor Rex [Cytobacillus oceanisediminis]MCM3395877.1 redox-sensing transcriptional repressor Rex [Cytobacillus oceanisedi